MKQIAVRRHKGGNGWCVADEERAHFSDEFAGALMRGVKFEPEAIPMACIPGYDSTGEAIGTLVKKTEAPKMPGVVKRSVEVVYDNKTRCFHEAKKPKTVIKDADYLALFPDGKAVAGWKE